MKVPRDVATCPTCSRTLELEVEEWDTDTGIPTETGVHPYCLRLHPNSEETRMPYVYWMPIQQRVYRWACEHVRVLWTDKAELVTPAEYERRRDEIKLAEWQAWASGTAAGGGT